MTNGETPSLHARKVRCVFRLAPQGTGRLPPEGERKEPPPQMRAVIDDELAL
ncbi:hypothetical protein HC028_11490 [Planosporangium flavigriseum]|uniref:hypothetical protein n=1 Tax=Planosporangium flavigriseum TaxID=373681 RepID=UPI0014395718|nr:hypothetical protein [Planosporangium flavigriseum]NJC65120.1 hypothetical protein [Planosporangium flavigriseum]